MHNFIIKLGMLNRPITTAWRTLLCRRRRNLLF